MTTYEEELMALINMEDDYGKMVTIWYMPTERSRKWRKASTTFILCAENRNTDIELRDEFGWDRVLTVEEGYNPNAPDSPYATYQYRRKNGMK